MDSEPQPIQETPKDESRGTWARRVLPRPGAAVLSGIVLTLAFPKPNLWPLIFVGLAPLALALKGQSPKTGFLLGGLFGWTHAASLMPWLVGTLMVYGGLHWIPAILIFVLLSSVLALFMAVFAWLLNLSEKWPGLVPGGGPWILTGAFLFCGLEYTKRFVMTGFPWEPLGAALHANLYFVQLSDIVGVAGLTWLIVLVNLGVAGMVMGRRRKGSARFFSAGAAVILPLILLPGYGAIRLDQIRQHLDRSVQESAAVVQGDIYQELKWDSEHRLDIMVIYRDLTFQAARGAPRLIVWPETSTPFFFPADEKASTWLQDVVRLSGSPLLFGAPAYEESGDETHYFNRAYLMNAQGKVLGHYDKVHLVPYGEYVPFQEYFPFLGKVSEATGNYRRGEIARILHLDGVGIGVLICYESIFPELARRQVKAGAQWLAVMTNDAWFGNSSAPYQHFSQAVIRAVENRRTVIRAANTGISGIILPTGDIEVKMGMFKRGVFAGFAPIMNEQTVYTRVGDVIPRLGLVWAAVLFFATLYRRRRHAYRSQTKN